MFWKKLVINILIGDPMDQEREVELTAEEKREARENYEAEMYDAYRNDELERRLEYADLRRKELRENGL